MEPKNTPFGHNKPRDIIADKSRLDLPKGDTSDEKLKQLEKEGKLIDDALRITIESENISDEVVGTLGRQTTQLEGISRRLDDFNETVGHARKTISSMLRRVVTDKAICFGIGFVILLAIILIIYFIVDSQIKN